MLYFITGNADKFKEMDSILGLELQQLETDLVEIQDIDPEIVVQAKLKEAHGKQQGAFIIEDTSLILEGLNGLPGPLIKWFMKSLGHDGLANLATKLDSSKAIAYTIIGYSDENNKTAFFKGEMHGTIVQPRGNMGFGWDPIFLPDGSEKTLAEMTPEEKNTISTRKLAARKLHEYLIK